MPTPVSTLARQLAPISQKTPAVPNPRVSAGVGVVQSVNTDNSVNVLFNGSIVPVNPATSTIPNIGTSVLIMTLGTQWWALGASLIAGGGGTVETGFAPLDSPVFTGIPEAPTAPQGTDTTQIATTEFVMTAITAATETTIGMDAGQESTIRTESVSQLAPPTSSFNMNTQALVNIGAMTVFDGTGANGSIGFSTNPAKIGIQAVNGDSSAILAFGSLFGNGAISFGGPPRITNSAGHDDAAPADVFIYRNAPGSIFCPGDFVHGGRWTLGTNPAAFALYRTQSDAQFFLGMGSLFGQSWLGLGPGGSGICDVQLFRAPSGPCIAAWQLGNQNVGPGTMTWWDGVASDGMVQVGFQTAKVAVLQNSTDTNACIAVGATGFGGGLLLGAGGTSPLDVQLYHLGAATGVWRLNTMNWWNGNAIDGAVRVNFDSANHVPSISILKNYGDALPVVAIGSVLGSGALQLGGGGSGALDVTLARNGVGAAEWLMAGPMTWWDGTSGDPLTKLTGNIALQVFANNTDVQPITVLGGIFGQASLQFGAGGSAGPDITLTRPSTGTLSLIAPTLNITSTSSVIVGDGTSGHGQLTLSTVSGPILQVFGVTTDTQPKVLLGSVFTVPALEFGPGGSTNPDVILSRTGAAAVQMAAASMTWVDGTAGHGSITFTSNPYLARFYAVSTDTQPLLALGSASGLSYLQMGPGGSTAIDVMMQRSAAGVASFTGNASNQGMVQITLASTGGNLLLFKDSTDAQPMFHFISTVFGIPVLQIGPGGSTSADVSFERPSAGVWAQNAGSSAFRSTTAQTLGTGTTITPNSSHVQITATGVTTNTAHPTITAGSEGQVIVVVNTGTNAITLTSNSSSAGTNLSLGAATRVIGAKGSITLIYNTTLTEWVEIGFNGGTFG